MDQFVLVDTYQHAESKCLFGTGKDRKMFAWQTIQREDGNIVAVLEENNIRFENIFRKTGETIEWR